MSKLIGRRVALKVTVDSREEGSVGTITKVHTSFSCPYPIQVEFSGPLGKWPEIFKPEELRYLNNRKVVL